MSRTARLTATIALALSPALAHAQDPQAAANTARAKEGMAPLAGMIGNWEGEASATTGPGQTQKARQTEEIISAANGTVLQVRGTGRDPSTGAIIYEAAGTIWFDIESGRIRMRTHNNGRSIEPEVEVRPDTIVWGFAVPGGRVRYTTAFTADTWHEVGEFVREGAPPIRTMEMRLRRTAP